MFDRSMKLTLAVVCLGLVSGALAQEPEVVVGSIGFPKNAWGKQALPFDVTNNTDWLKFLIVETDVRFEGSYVNPHRVTRSNFVLEPGAKVKVAPVLDVPPNFGQMNLMVRVYDVVDTLDDLSLGKQVFEQPFRIKFPTPEGVVPYFRERLTLPPMVGNNGLFDNELVRLMMVMVSEGKKLSEIAAVCKADSAYVDAVAIDLDAERYLKKSGDTCWTQLPVITTAEAKAGKELSDKISDRLIEILTKNLGRRQPVIDSLKAAGVLSGDSTKFVEGGTVLYSPYPLVGGMYLWQVLGEKFIVGSRSLEIFLNTNYCDPKIGAFMYLVIGGDYFNGHQFFSGNAVRSGYNCQFGDSIPLLNCKPGFERKFQLSENIDWTYPAGLSPESFLYDSTVVNPVLRALDEGVQPILQDAIEKLRAIDKQYRQSDLPMGVRYWFWNLTASRTLDKLAASGTLKRSGNGQYKFTEYKK